MFRRLFRTRRSASPPNANAPNANAPNANAPNEQELINELNRDISNIRNTMEVTIESLRPLADAIVQPNSNFDDIRRMVRDIIENFNRNINQTTFNRINRRFAYIVHILKTSNTNLPNGLSSVNTTNVNNRNRVATLAGGYPPLGKMIRILTTLKNNKNRKINAAARRIQRGGRSMMARINRQKRLRLKNDINRTIRQIETAKQEQNFNGNGNGNGNGSVTGSARSSRAASSANSVRSAQSNLSNLNLSGLA